MLVNIDEKLKKQLEKLRNYNEKGCLDLNYKLLVDYIDELQNNWNELKLFLKIYKAMFKDEVDMYQAYKAFEKILFKMQEIESSCSNE